MGYHPRIESKDWASFLTSRCRNSELWFANNERLEEKILGFSAKYQEKHQVKIYALAIEGSHIQSVAHFPLGNRADFMRDVNSNIGREVKLTPGYPGGRLFERRYSSEILPDAPDIEDKFFYTVLQPVQDCLIEKLSEYPFYNCFHDAIWGIKRKFEVVRWGEYNQKKRYDPTLTPRDFTDVFYLTYSRLPGYDHLTKKEYALLMMKKLEERRVKIVNEHKRSGRKFLGRDGDCPYRSGNR